MNRSAFSLVVLFVMALPVWALSPADAIAQAHADLETIRTHREQYRYLSLYNIPEQDREHVIRVLFGHCQHLSREPDIIAPHIVANARLALLRVKLDDYRWDAAVWEKLADPYFTATIETQETKVIEKQMVVPWGGGIWPGDGRTYYRGAFNYIKTVREEVQGPKVKTQALAPWLTETDEQRKKLAQVVEWTQSKIPVVRADWFFSQTAAAVDRTPNYYDFLGVKDEKGFQKLIGADIKVAEEFGAELRESVALSGVTLNPRAIARHGTIGGGYWRTFDMATPKGDKNPLRVLGRDIEKNYDASEQYGHLPNGFWATGLFDRQGKRQDTAPDNIASDGQSWSNDRRVHVNISCMRCHSDAGMQNIDGWVRNLMEPPLQLRTADYKASLDLRRQYVRKLEPFIAKDRVIFADAVKSATGMTPREYSIAYARMWERYEDAKIGLDEAAAALGVTPARWRAALEKSVRAGNGDTVLSAMLGNNPRLSRVPIRVWEESYPDAQLVLRGYRQP